MVSDAENAALVEAAMDLESASIEFLREMVQTPSVNPPGEYEQIHALVNERFSDWGWDTETVSTPDTVLRDLGLDPTYPRPNLLGYVTRGRGPTIVLNAHFDTVPVNDVSEWSHPPFAAEIDGGRVYGRGANDSKGRIASYTLAARALEQADLLPENATVILAITCDEETGGQAGPGYLLDTGHIEPDYAIVEGNCEDIWIGASGVRQFRITVRGESAHAGMNPEGGANAILGANHILSAIEAYAEMLTNETSAVPGVGSPTCVPATIEGGTKTNVVPAGCTFTVDHRVPPDYDGDEIEQRFQTTIQDTKLPDGVVFDIEVTLRAEPYLSETTDSHVGAIQENAEAVFGHEFDLVGIRGFSDGRFFAAAGAKTINFGPGDSSSNPHGVDESVAVDQVRDAGAVVAASIVDIARISPGEMSR